MSEESVLLIFPPSAWGEIERFCQPLGILWLTSMLKQEGIDVTAVDLSAEGWYPRKLAQFISQGNFTHVGATILTPFRHVPYFIFQYVGRRTDKTAFASRGTPKTADRGRHEKFCRARRNGSVLQ